MTKIEQFKLEAMVARNKAALSRLKLTAADGVEKVDPIKEEKPAPAPAVDPVIEDDTETDGVVSPVAEQTVVEPEKTRRYLSADELDNHTNTREEIIHFFEENPNPTDEMIHQWSEDNDIAPEDLEGHLYALLTEFINADKAPEQQPQDNVNQQMDQNQNTQQDARMYASLSIANVILRNDQRKVVAGVGGVTATALRTLLSRAGGVNTLRAMKKSQARATVKKALAAWRMESKAKGIKADFNEAEVESWIGANFPGVAKVKQVARVPAKPKAQVAATKNTASAHLRRELAEAVANVNAIAAALLNSEDN